MAVSNEAREVLYMFGHSDVGITPGGFGEALISAFAKADSFNFARLSSAFPEYGRLIHIIKNSPNGREELLADE